MRVYPGLAPSPSSAPASSRPEPGPTLARIAADLEVAAAAREAQLKALPPATTPVAVAHRESVLRILDAIRAAQAQLADGTYGTCHRCGGRADLHLALSRPRSPLCGSCASR